ncbi:MULTISPECIES: hypothetical protein [unclassified Neorhizobium]|uniref:hypothetical protein n=1 Tax=unclassified Neorhizobium TaxID=2629175 RepID=UPI001FF3A084|nr:MULTISPECIES: hypothetical protein [unclassified Neorhizobium]MCJ9671767.1 hypothetical protein [Neorhizobium sp. SHOUNA12B]MCJ9743853.1 hypothetical protein [Neorhizobium sp. SHOUNA12A]
MKVSLGTSLVLHSLVLGLALVSLSAPASFDVADVEALPVDIVPVESITQTQQGDKKAPPSQKPSPKETKNQKIVDNAQNAGENNVDLKTPPTPTTKPQPTETTAAPKPVERPTPTPTPEQNQVKDIVKEETAPKPTEMAALPQPKPEITPPKPEPTPPKPEPTPPKPEAAKPTPAPLQSENTSETGELPQSVPAPASRPQPPKPEPPKEQAKPVEKPAEKPAETKPVTAKAAETAKTDNKATASVKPSDKKEGKQQETAKSSSSMASDFNADQIAALLNKQEASGGGAKRSTQVASRGDTKTIGTGLSSSEIDNVKGQIQGNWALVGGLTGVSEVRVKIRVQLDQSGNIVGEPEVTATGGPEGTRRAVEGSTRRALMKSAPLKNLPAAKYEGEKGWNVLVLNFDPSEFAL